VRVLPILLAAWICAASAAAAEAPADPEIEEAMRLLHEGRDAEAVRLLKRLHKQAGGRCAPCLVGLAVADVRARDFGAAVRHARAALALAPDPEVQAAAHLHLGVGLLGQGGQDPTRVTQAEAALRHALELSDGGLNAARYYLGQVLARQGRDEEARSWFEEYLRAGPEAPLAASARWLAGRPSCAREPCAPDFSLVTLGGDRIDSGQLGGKVVLLEFWATWCGPCVDSLPHVRSIATLMDREPLLVVGVSVDREREVLDRFVAKHDVDWPQCWDPEGALTRGIFGVRQFPTYVLIDHRGMIRLRASGWPIPESRSLRAAVLEAVADAKRDGPPRAPDTP
jgi:thiol-disulfide isomerase/thioredoxin